MPCLLISTSAITWPAERLNLLRVDLSTSSGDSYAAGSYFVGILPEWFVATEQLNTLFIIVPTK